MADSIPTAAERRQRYRETMIEDVLTIAREMMQKEGVAALSFNAIARRVGLKPPSLYTYFDSKNAIYDELFRYGFLELGQWMQERPHQDDSLRENMISIMETYMRFAQENPDLYQLMFQRPVPDFVPSEESMAVSMRGLSEVQNQFASMFESDGLELNMPLEEVCDLFLALQHGLTELHLANNPELPAGEGRFGKLIPQAVQMMLDAWQKS